MHLLRSLLLKQPIFALAIGLAALALRLAVPAGFMPASDHGRYVLAPCPGAAATAAMAGMSHPDDGEVQVQGSCAFADLSVPAIGGAGAAAVTAPAFVAIAAAVAGAPWPRLAALRLRPPLRGPPLPR